MPYAHGNFMITWNAPAPSKYQSKGPLVDSSMSPSKDLSKDQIFPQLDPSKTLSKDLSTIPLKDPAMNPSKEWSKDPSMDQKMVVFMDPSIGPLMNPLMDLLIDHFMNPSVDPLMDPTNDTSLEHSGCDYLHQIILVCAWITMLLQNHKESCPIDWKINGKISACRHVPYEY